MIHTVIVKDIDFYRFKLSIPTFDPNIKIKKIAEEKYEVETNIITRHEIEKLSYINSVVIEFNSNRGSSNYDSCMKFGQVCNRLELYVNDPTINISYRSAIYAMEKDKPADEFYTGYEITDLINKQRNTNESSEDYLGTSLSQKSLNWATSVKYLTGYPIVNTSFVENRSIALLIFDPTI